MPPKKAYSLNYTLKNLHKYYYILCKAKDNLFAAKKSKNLCFYTNSRYINTYLVFHANKIFFVYSGDDVQYTYVCNQKNPTVVPCLSFRNAT